MLDPEATCAFFLSVIKMGLRDEKLRQPFSSMLVWISGRVGSFVYDKVCWDRPSLGRSRLYGSQGPKGIIVGCVHSEDISGLSLCVIAVATQGDSVGALLNTSWWRR